MTPYRLGSSSAELPAVLALIQTSFAYMEDRIDPPSSMHRLTMEGINFQAQTGEARAMGAPPVACIFLTYQPDAIYIGKLSVAPPHRGKGLARRLVDLAKDRARVAKIPKLWLESRVELIEIHQAFSRMGFVKTGTSAHKGFDRPTSFVMECEVA